jgi:UDP-glucuronate 4-epimerase
MYDRNNGKCGFQIMKKKILLTGTRGYRPGFIGGNFLRLYADKYDIVEYLDDIRDWNHSKHYWEDLDCIVHLAAMAGVRRSHQEPELYWDVNVNASKKIFESIDNSIPIIYASSSSVYEWWLSPYATTKWAMEAIAPENSLGLRFHTVYGPNSRTDMIYDKLLKKEVSYITRHTRDWTHVEDVCSALDICIENFDNLKKHRAIDVGNGEPVTVKQLADRLWPNNGLVVKEVTGERENTCADPSILLEYGWKPKHHVLE